MSVEKSMLTASMLACAQRISKLGRSVKKVYAPFPLTLERALALTDEEEESIDALILRYSQCVSMIQDQLFRGIAYLEQEDVSDKSNRDKALLMEKLSAIRSAEAFGTATVLRNKFSHHYLHQSQSTLGRMNMVFGESQFVIATFGSIAAYLQRKGFG